MLPEPSKTQILNAILAPNQYWTTPTITFSIPKLGSTWPGYGGLNEPSTPNYGVFNATQASNFRAAIAAFARVIDKPLVETDDLAQPGNIRIAFSDNGGHAYYPPVAGATPAPINGDIWIESSWSKFTLAPGRVDGAQTFETLLHELGHALGLQHIHEGPNALAPGYWNSTRVSVMAYNTAIDQIHYTYFRTTANSVGWDRGLELVGYNGPMVYDILALQTLYGANKTTGAGNTTYTWDPNKAYFETIYDAGGVDTINLADHTRGSIIDLTPGAYSSIDYFSAADQKAYWSALYPEAAAGVVQSYDDPGFAQYGYQWKNNVGIAFGTIIENVVAGSGDDTILGNEVANDIRGGAGNDRISGAGGDDVLMGGPGNDRLDGAEGDDTAIYTGTRANYEITDNPDGSRTIRDLRPGSPDGTDILISVERLVFAPSPSAAEITSEMNAILRASGSAALVTLSQDLLARWAAGSISADQVTAQIVKTAGATTSVATLAYEFFTGKIPSQAGVDYLVSPTGPNPNNLNSAYYQSFNLENRYINFAVNLGKLGEGKDAFTAKYGALTLFDATREAYKSIFGAAPTDAKIHALIDTRADYFAAYGGDGASGIGTKAAMVGWLLAEAQKADLGVMVRSNDAWLTDLADGSAPFAINLLDPSQGYYRADFIFGGA